jgi:Phosphatidylinositol-4-phosphate 5-Kinase
MCVRAVSCKVLKDLNFIDMTKNNMMDVTVGEKSYQVLMDSLKKDSQFLASIDVIDYSLLIGVHNCNTRYFNFFR